VRAASRRNHDADFQRGIRFVAVHGVNDPCPNRSLPTSPASRF
jgi:hypothetical protein